MSDEKPTNKRPPDQRLAMAALEENAMRVSTITFRQGINLPMGLDEANVMKLSSLPRNDGKQRFSILYQPRIDKFIVRALDHDGRPGRPFLVPGDWGVAEFVEP